MMREVMNKNLACDCLFDNLIGSHGEKVLVSQWCFSTIAVLFSIQLWIDYCDQTLESVWLL